MLSMPQAHIISIMSSYPVVDYVEINLVAFDDQSGTYLNTL